MRRTGLGLPLGLLGVTALLIGAAPNAQAATAYSLYSYDLSTVSGSAVANAAATNAAVSLQLVGSWSTDPLGVLFTGDQASEQSVGTARPSSGYTLNVAETRAVGVAIRFRYAGPQTGTCFTDSPNLTQIGRYGTRIAQVKLQLSNCGINKTSVFPQCRIAGGKSSSPVWPRTSSRALVDGTTYVVYCFEGVPSGGTRTLFLRTTPVGSPMTSNQWAFPTPGAITSYSYLSVANKYPLPSQSNNTDQFNGAVAKVAYCSGPTPGVVSTCLMREVPNT